MLKVVQIVVYVLVLAAIVVAMLWSRSAAERTFATQEAQTDWQMWRNDVRESRVGDATVERVEPKSPLPPALVLLRDHFAACLAIALIISSALYWTFAFMIGGVIRSGHRGPHRASSSP